MARRGSGAVRCPNCGRQVQSLRCGHCGSHLPDWQANLYGAAIRQLAKMGGDRTDAGNQGGDAIEYSDEYYTPDAGAALLLPFLPKNRVVWECAWGKGHLARYLQGNGYSVVGSPRLDFLRDPPPLETDIIVTNPPFSQKVEFIERAYDLGKPFAFLLPADSLVRVKLFPLFAERGVQLLVPDKRIHFLGGSPKYQECPGSSYHTFWFCWRLLPRDVCFAKMKTCGLGDVEVTVD